jgi:sugar phosphate isomerase/epimerase
MSRIPIALELYSVRNEMAKDPLATLKAVKAMGYEGVEFAGDPKHTAEEYAAMLKETGLVCCGWHTGFHRVQDDTIEETIALNKAVDNEFVIIPGVGGEFRESAAALHRLAGIFNDLVDKLGAADLSTGYHNHNWEFAPIDGELPWDVIFGATKKEFIMQIDTGNALHGGANPIAFFEKYPGRSRTVHLKPYHSGIAETDLRAGFATMIGEDTVPWQDVFDFCETKGATEWYIVEYESDKYPALEAVDRCLKAVKAMGK